MPETVLLVLNFWFAKGKLDLSKQYSASTK